jgi:non-ribosomal peptide synthase protein (TIGR01720 family)
MIANLYGPTEASVDVSALTFDGSGPGPTVPIGRPVFNTQLGVLDSWGHPVPIGVPGELCLGGVQLARGYLNRPDLTAERFTPDPFGSDGGRLYRSGDLARWLPDGTVEYLGRLDHQVKLRGYRIELGEIEAVLAQFPHLREVAVLAREDKAGDRRLVAYLVPDDPADAPTPEVLRTFLRARLPRYMLPAAFVVLNAMPLTPNGKLDRKALPSPIAKPRAAGSGAAPSTPSEEILARAWAEVLRVDRVGVDENFFELGGDSILGIQIVARVNQAGLRLTPKDLFEHQTIAELARVAVVSRPIIVEPGPIVGEVPLSPIQHWFFELGLTDPDHWNQALLLEAPSGLNPVIMERALAHLCRHHDALRHTFHREAGAWQQTAAPPDERAMVTTIDLSLLSGDEQRRAIESAAAAFQGTLNLSSGPLVRALHMNLGPGQSGRLLLVLHHLVVDGVSWRIILEDLQRAYQQLRSGSAVELPARTSSFRQWATRLREHAESDAVRGQLGYWSSARRLEGATLPIDHELGPNTEASSADVSVSLDRDETSALLREVPAAYHTQAGDALITALLTALARWTGRTRLLIDLEGHGREAIFDDIDLSRTVGWFTAIFPTLLELPGGGPGDTVKSVKEQLRQIPDRGLGHGVLRYLSADPAIRATLQSLPPAEVVFNYAGQFDQTSAAAGFTRAPELAGANHAPSSRRTHVLEVSAVIADGQLQAGFGYSRNLHHRETIERIAQEFIAALRELIAHCVSAGAGGYTPSDFPQSGLQQAELDRLLESLDGLEEQGAA